MDRQLLDDLLTQGLSLEAIGERVGRHPSTVSYWIKKHGLEAVGSRRHSPRGEIDRGRLEELLEEGASIRAVARELGLGYSTVRYWLGRFELETARGTRIRRGREARAEGRMRVTLRCPRHGQAQFYARKGGGFRCARCNAAAVVDRRRQVKRLLVDEAGGSCRLCGFSGHPAAMHFHHLDPRTKSFHPAEKGMSRGIDRLREETSKCVLLCANCHALVEAGVEKLPARER